MSRLLIADDELNPQNFEDEDYLEEFVKGFEILKLRIGKLRSYSIELD